uniref:Uncharacterized protein n=1 Tax=Panagrolaimus sp. ES5 TaxID=591445 RepID=A0AC34F4A6_9BILA
MNYFLQENGAKFVANVAAAATTEDNTILLIEAGVLPPLVKLLKSKNPDVLFEAVCALRNISSDFSKEVVANQAALPSLVKCFKAKTSKMLSEVVLCFTSISKESENIPLILEAGAVKPLIKLLEFKYIAVRKEALKALLNIIFDDSERCQQILDDGALEAASNNIIENIVKFKNDYVSILINNYDIISLITNNLEIENAAVVENILSTLKTFFEIDEFKKLCFQKFKDCNGPEIIENLKFEDDDEEEILELSNWIKDFVNSCSTESNSDVNTSESPNRSLKRSPDSEVEGPNIKKLKISLDEQNGEQPVASMAEVEHVDFDSPEQNHPFDQSNNNDEELHNNNFDDINSPPADSIPNIEPSLPEETNTVDAADLNDVKPFSLVSPIVINFPAGETTPLNNANRNENTFASFKYFSPSEHFLDECCEKLGLKFNAEEYFTNFRFKIKITQISSDSKPDTILELNDKSGFGCLSMLFTGTEQHTQAIWKELNGKVFKFYDDMNKIQNVIASKILTDEHLEIIVSWLKCRILIYCNGTWKKYGIWNSEAEDVPLFVLEKKENGSETIYQIILSFKLEK